jgi:hypothetical protein
MYSKLSSLLLVQPKAFSEVISKLESLLYRAPPFFMIPGSCL